MGIWQRRVTGQGRLRRPRMPRTGPPERTAWKARRSSLTRTTGLSGDLRADEPPGAGGRSQGRLELGQAGPSRGIELASRDFLGFEPPLCDSVWWRGFTGVLAKSPSESVPSRPRIKLAVVVGDGSSIAMLALFPDTSHPIIGVVCPNNG